MNSTEQVNITDLDQYIIQNIMRFIPRDSVALRATCKYMASTILIKDIYIWPNNAYALVSCAISDPNCTIEKMRYMAREYPTVFSKSNEIILNIIKKLPLTHMRAVIDIVNTDNWSKNLFIRYAFVDATFLKFMQSKCDDSMANDIIAITTRYAIFDYDYAHCMISVARSVIAKIMTIYHAHESNIAKHRLILSCVNEYLSNNMWYSVYKISSCLILFFFPELIFDRTPEIRNSLDICSIITECTDVQLLVRIIDEYNSGPLIRNIMISMFTKHRNVTMLRELRRANDALFGKNMFVSMCAFYVNYIISCVTEFNNTDYRLFWRDAFIIDRAIDHIDKLSANALFLNVCNPSDIDEFASIEIDVNYNFTCDIDMYVALISRNIINTSNCYNIIGRLINNYYKLICSGFNIGNVLRYFFNVFPCKPSDIIINISNDMMPSLRSILEEYRLI
jgi:hypothetical protein